MTKLETGKKLQLVIAAAGDLPTTLSPLRVKRTKRSVKLAAGLGTTSAVVGGALFVANIGFWSSVGMALGLGTVPLLLVAGTRALSLGLPRGRARGNSRYAAQRDHVALTYACFSLMAEADGRISEEERVLLRSVLLQHPLSPTDRERIEGTPPLQLLQRADEFDEELRLRVLQGTWMLAESDGATAEEDACFAELVAELAPGTDVRELKKQSRALQQQLNELVTGMFRTCQQVLSPDLGAPSVNAFLESLAAIAATPAVRRSLRNTLTSGFSAGGVLQTLNEQAQAHKLVAQACNGTLAVYEDKSARKAGRTRLLDLAESSNVGRREARRICGDVEALFAELEAESPAEDAAG